MSINNSKYIAKSDNTRIEYPYNIINNFKDFRERLREYKIGGRFTPKKSQLVKNAETQNTKRDMRKKVIK